MSSSEERTPTISPDPGATGETTTSSENKEAGTQTGLSEEEEEAHYKEEYNNAVFKLLKNISMQDPGTRSGYSDGVTLKTLCNGD